MNSKLNFRIRSAAFKRVSILLFVMVAFVYPVHSQEDQGWGSWPTREQARNDSPIRRTDFQAEVPLKADPVNSEDEFGQTMRQGALGLLNVEEATTESGSWVGRIRQSVMDIDLVRMLGALAIVLGGYFAFVLLMRKINPRGSLGLPREVVEVLGQTPFGPRKNLQLVRLGSKLLLLSQGNEGTQTIGEITDPNEVEYLTSLCGGKRHGRSAIAIGKASANASNASQELNKILRQLNGTSNETASRSVFEA